VAQFDYNLGVGDGCGVEQGLTMHNTYPSIHILLLVIRRASHGGQLAVIRHLP
jgi:hypothetical protein